MSPRLLAIAAWFCHATLLAAVLLGLATSTFPVAARAALTIAAVVPLVLSAPGLYRGQRHTYQWLAFALVAYAGAAAVEVVATLGRSSFASIALLAALTELGLLFVLNRSRPPPPRATPG